MAIETSRVFRPPVRYFYSRGHWNIRSIQAPSLVLLHLCPLKHQEYSGPQSGTFTPVAIETARVFRPPVWYFYTCGHWNIRSIQAPSLVLLHLWPLKHQEYSGTQSGTFTPMAIETSRVFRPPVRYFSDCVGQTYPACYTKGQGQSDPISASLCVAVQIVNAHPSLALLLPRQAWRTFYTHPYS